MGHARALLPLHKPTQRELAKRVITNQLSVREVEKLAGIGVGPAKIKPKKSRDTQKVEEELMQALGRPVTLGHKKNGRGKISIFYQNLDDLDALIERLKKL